MVMKHIDLSILATVLLAASTARAGTITMTLDAPVLYGNSGAVLGYSGTLTNTTADVVWLNADNYNLPAGIGPSAFDDTPFFTNAPLFLAANGTSGDIGLFNITIPAGLANGTFSGGTFTVLGGAGGDSQDILASVDFTVGVGPQPNNVPEPDTLPPLAAGLVVGGLALAIKRCAAVRAR
jgi:hypothetical protein